MDKLTDFESDSKYRSFIANLKSKETIDISELFISLRANNQYGQKRKSFHKGILIF